MEESNVAQPVENQAQVSKSASKSKLPLMLGVIFVLLIILGSGAYYYLGLQTKNTNQQTSITPTVTQNSPTPITDPTANWKTYTNVEYGYTFKYPKSYSIYREYMISPFSLEEPIFALSSSNINNGGYQHSVFSISQSQNISKCYYYYLNPRDNTAMTAKQNINGIEYMHATIGPSVINASTSKFYRTIKNETCIDLHLSNESVPSGVSKDSNKDSQNILQQELDQILSTFKFTDEYSNWKTYKDNKYGFSFKYPNDWVIKLSNQDTTLDLCDVYNINPSLSPKALSRFKACEGSNISPSTSIKITTILNINFALPNINPPIQLYSYDNPENLIIEMFNDKYLKFPVAGDPISIWDRSYEEVTNTNGINAYYSKEYYCVAKCQAYIFQNKNKIFKLKNFPTDAPNQDEIFNLIFSTFKFAN